MFPYKFLIIITICNLVILKVVIGAKNFDRHISGPITSFCFKQIPRNSIAGTCSRDGHCVDLDIAAKFGDTKCGLFGECVVKELLQDQEFCKDACDSSPCGKLCLQQYESKTAKYCIQTTEHFNSIVHSKLLRPKRFQCVCIQQKKQIYFEFNY